MIANTIGIFLLIVAGGAFLLFVLSSFSEQARPQCLGFVVTLVEKEDEVERLAAWVELDKRLAGLIKMLDLEILRLEKDYPCFGLVVTGNQEDLELFKAYLELDQDITVEFIGKEE